MSAADEGVVLTLDVQVPRGEVLRFLGYPPAKSPSTQVSARLEPLLAIAPSLLRPRGAYVLSGRADALRVGVPRPTERIAFAICTIGLPLEEEEARLSRDGDALGAMILDAMGSAAAEAAADRLHARVCAAVQAERLKAAMRISPGYGRWDLVRQTELLARLPTAAVGVRLTSGSMMIPRKSVSFAVLTADASEKTSPARCAACDRNDCPYRRSEPSVRDDLETE
ncbi:MAG: hypothetical protein MUF54_10040 [Polyangiaceae bacterium]|jgi:hypothetical protein|nr:hypothetical protein [Polyangiaceae bacterium]